MKKNFHLYNICKHTIYIWLLCGTICFLNSCATQKSVNRQISTARTEAADYWLKTKNSQEKNDKRIDIKSLSIEQAVNTGLQNNKTYLSVLKEKDIAQGRILKAYKSVLPNISANAEFTRLDEAGTMDIGKETIKMGFQNNYSADITVRQPIFHGGAIPAALRGAYFYNHYITETCREAMEDTIFSVIKAYYDVVLSQHLLTVDKQAVENAKLLLKDVTVKKENGIASAYDILRSEVEVSNAEAEMIQQKNKLELAKTRLFKVMGVSKNSNADLESRLKYSSIKPVLQKALSTAFKNRPVLHKAEIDKLMRQETVRIAKSEYWPNVDIFFIEEWANPDPHSSMQDEWGDAWTAMATVSVPLFEGGSRYGKVKEEQARLEQSILKITDLEQQTVLEVEQAFSNLEDAEELVESQKMNLNRAKEGLRLVQAGYREGINTEVEVTDAATALTRTRALYYKALYVHNTAKLKLAHVTGILVPERSENIDFSDINLNQEKINDLLHKLQ
jgi:outer membrane protein